ncbi:phosphoadenosine phosphosulfate reductase family protein [Comamonas testosteroni]|uniref:phosphoadenosine phosphosulfate reductase family protein n=1 Tax=Comamonas testosteroni TaxID=285 RepID=UPI00266031EA|nr:phosphoadenosine phosphosulfate reductase family protein [Comamonas testosteroni]WKL16681.1 phosphoadenosine phosphosulfate reductase family protein [Comamonas testosteroni]
MVIKHVISVSGGKDSTALLALALERCPAENVVPIFCDTGNEHQAVYDYLIYLEQALGVSITRLKADFTERFAVRRMFIARDQRTRRDKSGRKVRWSNKAKRRALAVLHPSGNPFLDLCMLKGRFPSRKAQFCTEELKRNMAVEFQLGLLDQGHRVISWQGVRRDESAARRNAKMAERIGPGLRAFRPLVEWTAAQVFEFTGVRCIHPNPLYLQGADRVGCMPCINCSKSELRQISQRWPEHPKRISEWEHMVGQCSKRGYSTFFTDSNKAKDRRKVFADLNVWTRIEWAQTTRGGKQFDLLAQLNEPHACASSYGLCE